MSTKLNIISNAMVLIGSTPVYNMEEISEYEGLFDTTYNSMLSLKNWKFAQKRIKLERLNETSLFGYNYVFQLPSDFLNITKINNENIYSLNYEINEDTLLCNEEDVEIEYVSKDIEIDKIISLLIEYLEYKMASKLAIPVAEDSQLAFTLSKFADEILKKASQRESVNEKKKLNLKYSLKGNR